MKKNLGLIVAHLCVGLAFVGLFIPLLPTTPFLLLAASLYIKRSKRMYSWLMNHPLFGSIVYDYTIHRSVKLKHKVGAGVMLWVGIGWTLLVIELFWVRFLLIGVGLAVSLHLYGLKTRPIETVKELPTSPVISEE